MWGFNLKLESVSTAEGERARSWTASGNTITGGRKRGQAVPGENSKQSSRALHNEEMDLTVTVAKTMTLLVWWCAT